MLLLETIALIRPVLRSVPSGYALLEFPHIVFSTTVCDLGVILDSELTLFRHLSQLILGCYFKLRELRVVSRFLSVCCYLLLYIKYLSS